MTQPGRPSSDELTLEQVSQFAPRRALDAHKYSAGTVVVVAGSARYLGAAELACRGAYRAGAGLVTLVAEARLASSWAEIIFEQVAGKLLEQLASLDANRAQVRVIGPGLDGVGPAALAALILQTEVPTVLDAGALIRGDVWQHAVREHGRCVLTPHAGEAARLLDCSSESVIQTPRAAALSLAERYNAIVVLKGATTYIAAPDGRVLLSRRGHPGMATGGAGDVLAGVIGAWLARADDVHSRTAAAVYLHGYAGELAAARYGNGLIATDIAEHVAVAWCKLANE